MWLREKIGIGQKMSCPGLNKLGKRRNGRLTVSGGEREELGAFLSLNFPYRLFEGFHLAKLSSR